ncbi:MAG: hypothetical protein QOD75_579 [Blastocatellia bacterium]|jgi:curved DNA-binding protein CbpA|nr:hypothetical protein [Blastocatellia bacterium]
MKGQISEHPLAELIREIGVGRVSGALRVERERVKVVVYFEAGEVIFATANLRTHRLGEVLKRSGALNPEQLAGITQTIERKDDAALEAFLLNEGLLRRSLVEKLRIQQAADVLRTALILVDGEWTYDPRVRLAEKVRTKFDLRPLLLECARRLPRSFILSRFPVREEIFSPSPAADNGIGLLPAEAFLLSRVDGPMRRGELTALSGLRDAEALRIAYALTLTGLLQRSHWPSALKPVNPQGKEKATSQDDAPAITPEELAAKEAAAVKRREERELEFMLSRVSHADDHYEVLDVARGASINEIKNAYHKLARSFHPDKFHKSELHSRVESAFARFAHAYETLSDLTLRAAYDTKLAAEETTRRATRSARHNPNDGDHAAGATPRGMGAVPDSPERSRAEVKFQQGLTALAQEKNLMAVRCFGEAAQLAPHEARYRAHYGNALTDQPQGRRLAEAELQAAISLDPNNASYHVMLARLCRELGFARRAQTALERALALDPRNDAARQLLGMLERENTTKG